MESRRNWYVGIGLFVVTMILYWPVTTFPFICFDDQLYVYENAEVLRGLSWDGVRWAATSVVAANWHPVSVLSHMADCSAYGTFAGGHHFTNILLHSLNAVLLLLLLNYLTRLFWPSLLVAAMFAWQPMNVESVVWISERKNVLSVFFFILTIWAYVGCFRNRVSPTRRTSCYGLSLIFFALGLASKPMLVTLPFLLLLLDYWPLERFSSNATFVGWLRQRAIMTALLEKTPFFALALADCVVTYLVQDHSGAIQSFVAAPFEVRSFNMPIAYVLYLARIFWPFNLCLFYPFSNGIPVAEATACLIVLLTITGLAWRWKLRRPWIILGWFWFLGTMIPVIGLVQVGDQSMADRYAYQPLIGIYLILALGLYEYVRCHPKQRSIVVFGVSLFLAMSLIATGRQMMYWQDNITLFSRCVAMYPENNPRAHVLLARAYVAGGQHAQAAEQYLAAVRLRPDLAETQYDLGRELISLGKFKEASTHLGLAVKLEPTNPVFRNTLGVALMMDNDVEGARSEMDYAVRLQSDYPKPYFNLGKLMLKDGQASGAISNLIVALKLQPDWLEAQQALAEAYAVNGDYIDACAQAQRAYQLACLKNEWVLAGEIRRQLETYRAKSSPQAHGGRDNL